MPRSPERGPNLKVGDEWPYGYRGGPTTSVGDEPPKLNGFFHRRSPVLPPTDVVGPHGVLHLIHVCWVRFYEKASRWPTRGNRYAETPGHILAKPEIHRNSEWDLSPGSVTAG